jgi:hypothetical protein
MVRAHNGIGQILSQQSEEESVHIVTSCSYPPSYGVRWRGTECVLQKAERMLTIAEAQQRTEFFLTAQMIEALRAVEYELPSFDAEPREVQLADAARSRV